MSDKRNKNLKLLIVLFFNRNRYIIVYIHHHNYNLLFLQLFIDSHAHLVKTKIDNVEIILRSIRNSYLSALVYSNKNSEFTQNQ